MECGAQCVMTDGTSRMLRLFVDNWAITEVSYNHFNLIIPLTTTAHLSMLRHPVSSNGSLFYHLDDVHCTGDEAKLSDCRHNGVGNHNCAVRREEAGVLCISKLLIHTFSVIILKYGS